MNIAVLHLETPVGLPRYKSASFIADSTSIHTPTSQYSSQISLTHGAYVLDADSNWGQTLKRLIQFDSIVFGKVTLSFFMCSFKVRSMNIRERKSLIAHALGVLNGLFKKLSSQVK